MLYSQVSLLKDLLTNQLIKNVINNSIVDYIVELKK